MKLCLFALATFLALTGAIPLHAGLREDGPRPQDLAPARAAILQKDFEVAAEAYAKMIVRYPNSGEAWLGLASCLSAQKFRAEAHVAYLNAANLYRERVRVFPKDAMAHACLIEALRGNPRGGNAKEALGEALRLNPTNPLLLDMRNRETPSPYALLTKEYKPSGFLMEEIAGKDREAVKGVLERHGVEFPSGASVFYISRSNRLIIRNTTAGHAAVESLLSAD